jgi:hypothetical protein
MKFDIVKANANLAIGSIWSNLGNLAKSWVVNRPNELEDFIVS